MDIDVRPKPCGSEEKVIAYFYKSGSPIKPSLDRQDKKPKAIPTNMMPRSTTAESPPDQTIPNANVDALSQLLLATQDMGGHLKRMADVWEKHLGSPLLRKVAKLVMETLEHNGYVCVVKDQPFTLISTTDSPNGSVTLNKVDPNDLMDALTLALSSVFEK